MDGRTSPNRFSRTLAMITAWMHAHRPFSFIMAGVIVATGIGTVAWAALQKPHTNSDLTPNVAQIFQEPEKKYYSPLTGAPVKDAVATKRQVTGVMIENSPDARPQSGMRDAGIIYEAIAEGGITRFLCIYQESRPGLVGPVRSLRPYYLEWLAPFDAAYAHVGGSYKSLQEVRSGKYKDIDQFFNPNAYYRSSDRVAPHNVYTGFDRLDGLNRSKGFTQSTFTSFPRKPAAPAPKPDARGISVDISSGLYNSTYAYDAASNSYVRSQDGASHLDRESRKPLQPKVLVVMKVAMSLGFEDGYREQIQTSGRGIAYVFQDGTVQQVTWSKRDTRSQLQLLDKNNKPLALNAGQTWITALPAERSVSWK